MLNRFALILACIFALILPFSIVASGQTAQGGPGLVPHTATIHCLKAQPGAFDQLKEHLKKKYGEEIHVQGITGKAKKAPTGIMAVFADPQDGSWTMAVSVQGRGLCLVGAGFEFTSDSIKGIPS